MGLPPYAERATLDTCLIAFGTREGGLALAVQKAEDGRMALPSLPHMVGQSLEDTIAEVVDNTGLGRQRKPAMWPLGLMTELPGSPEASRPHTHFRLGCVAAVHIGDPTAYEDMRFIRPGELGRRPGTLSRSDLKMAARGLASLQEPVHAIATTRATDRQTESALAVMARLVPDPASFTIDVLRQAFKNVLEATTEPDVRKEAPIDRWNFIRFSRAIGVEPNGKTVKNAAGKGRPPKLWTLPEHIVAGGRIS